MINLNLSREAQDLSIRTTTEREVDILVISEQTRDLHVAIWFKDKRGDATIYIYKDEHYSYIQLILLSERRGRAGGNGRTHLSWRVQTSRGDLLEEMMATYNLEVAKQPGVHTSEKGIIRSVLDLVFASPEVTKNISSW